MTSYGQFCSIARAHQTLGGRWTILIVRELLCGSRRFNDIRRVIPRISRTMLSERLQELPDAVEPAPGGADREVRGRAVLDRGVPALDQPMNLITSRRINQIEPFDADQGSVGRYR